MSNTTTGRQMLEALEKRVAELERRLAAAEHYIALNEGKAVKNA